MRLDGRRFDQMRNVVLQTKINKYAEGSVYIAIGDTKVLCTATVEEKVPPFLRNTGKGWITAEYSMVPRATKNRLIREVNKGRPSGRSMEIQRFIGRSLRSVVDLKMLGERTVWIDCDVIQADGGTRTAAITGSFVAMVFSFSFLKEKDLIPKIPIKDFLAATSVGIIGKEKMLDLTYEEDSIASVDMNIVMTGGKKYVEIQGAGEGNTFEYSELLELLSLGSKGIEKLVEEQKKVLEAVL